MKKFRPVLTLVLGLTLFFVSLELLGDSFKLFGKEAAQSLFKTASNPFVGLFIGILATTLAQSSSTVTSMTVTAVSTGAISPMVAHPIVMGANIGTTVTNTIVSLGHIRDREEFKRALGGATVHDFFNIIVVAILFPLEITTHYLHKVSEWFAAAFEGAGGLKFASPLKAYLTDPASNLIMGLIESAGLSSVKAWIALVIAAAFLFFGLRILVMSLKLLALDRSGNVIEKYIFKAGTASLLFGIAVTILVQSSSVTTSLAVPFVATGALSVAQIFPYICGANIGTTFTALLTAFVTQDERGLVVALGHFFFNLTGVLIVFPIRRLREVPVWLAERFGDLASRRRALAVVYTLILFYGIPSAVIFLTSFLSSRL